MDRIYNKLVRDKIPEIIKGNGETPVTRELDLEEYKLALETKLQEECKEVIMASGEERVEEIADVIEVLRALAKLEGVQLTNVLDVAENKNIRRGAFEKRIFLEKVITAKE